MKKFALLVIVLFTFAFIASYAQGNPCFENCDNPPFQSQIDSVHFGNTDCFVWYEIQYRTITCNGQTIYEMKVNVIMAVYTDQCGFYSLDNNTQNYIIGRVLGDPARNPFPFPEKYQCITQYLVSGPACWEKVYRSIGPKGSGWYFYNCDGAPPCCKTYSVCVDGQGVAYVNPQTYIPQSCLGLIGSESHQQCFNWCP